MYLNPLQMRSRIGIPILQQSHPDRTDYFPISHSLPLRKPKDTNQNTAEYKTKRNQPRKASAATKGGTGGWGSPLGADSRGSGLFELHWRRGLTFLGLLTQPLAPGVRAAASVFGWDCFHAGKGGDSIRTALPIRTEPPSPSELPSPALPCPCPGPGLVGFPTPASFQ